MHSVALPAPQYTPVSGGSSSVVQNDWGWSFPRAWDGDPTTVYSSASHGVTAEANEWVWVDTGESHAIGGVTLLPRPNGECFPVDFSIQTSGDASTWTDVPEHNHTAFANPGSAAVTLTFATPVVARYVRINATRLSPDTFGNNYLQLAEIQPF